MNEYLSLASAIAALEEKTGFASAAENGHSYEVCRMAAGLFIMKDGCDLSFSIKEKIPVAILQDAVRAFREEMPLEAAGRIYRRKDGTWFFHRLRPSSVSRIHVLYEDGDEPEEARMGEARMVSEVHSHNSMPAFFSEQDRVSGVYPGLYICIGRLDRECVSVACCAEMGFIIKALDPAEIFQ